MMINWINILLIFDNWSLLILRLVLGVILIVHGWPTIKSLKFRPLGNFWSTMAAIIEFIGGFALILGFYTQLAGLLLVFNMGAMALWKIKKGHKFIGGFELELILAATSLALATLGGGVYSLDQFYFLY